MNIHEHQAKELLARFGVAVPRGTAAFTAEEAGAAARALGGPVWVVKAQIHAGGRGKAGGVKVVKSVGEVEAAARTLLGATLVTHQTGPAGRVVKRVYVEEGCDIERELYLGLLLDRQTGRLTFMASTEGGMDIEEVARDRPGKILRVAIDPASGLQPYHTRRIAYGLGLSGEAAKSAATLVSGLWRAYTELDASLAEINPLVVTGKGAVIALDAKMNFDDNALYRHPDIEAMLDPNEVDATELEAGKHNLNYVKLDGQIGCMVNGAGLAMATMDIIKLHGAEPANFLDVGGGATKERVEAAFKLILTDPNVKGILVNIFGGIVRCDVIAEGVVAAARALELSVPLVVRLVGTNMEQGKAILGGSGLKILAADDLDDAAEKIVKAVKEAA